MGVKLFRTPGAADAAAVRRWSEGDIFSTAKLRKGIENLRKLYGEFGYIDFVPEPNFDPLPDTDKIDLTLTVDEGKQFFVRRIDFSGNTTTRDKVIRRELLLDEGDMFNTRLWELSILRLNQLGYFEVLKENEAADIKRDTKTNTVDITLKVKERGKNSVQLNGGVSGHRRQLRGLRLLHQQLPRPGRDAEPVDASWATACATSASASPSRTSWTARCRSASRSTCSGSTTTRAARSRCCPGAT